MGEVNRPAVVMLRPIKAGLSDPLAQIKHAAEALHPGDALIVGLDSTSPHDAALRKLPMPDGVTLQVVACDARPGWNPKIAKLAQMQSAAIATGCSHALLLDAEATPSPRILDLLRREWIESDRAAITAGYCFSATQNLWQKLDALPVATLLIPGVLCTARHGTVPTTLGACIGVRLDTLTAVGGWERFSSELAEDHALGQALAAHGESVCWSHIAIPLEADAMGFKEMLRHQLRVAITYRSTQPAGFAGCIFTQTMAMIAGALALYAEHPGIVIGAVLLLAFRYTHTCMNIRALRQAADLPAAPARYELLWLLPLSSILDTVCWTLAWGARHTWWAGRRWRISFRGKLLS